jgi:hypothetical protein
MNIAVVTCITGGVDSLIENQPVSPDIRYVAYTDVHRNSELWKVERARIYMDSRMTARRIKWLFHRLVCADYTLWIDGNVRIVCDIKDLIKTYLDGSDICTFRHDSRNNVYDEAEKCIRDGLDDPGIINSQMKRYKDEGFSGRGLYRTIVILRRNTDIIERFNEEVWKEIKYGSVRDQLAVGYVAWKMGINVNVFDSRFKGNGYFEKIKHKSSNRKLKNISKTGYRFWN